MSVKPPETEEREVQRVLSFLASMPGLGHTTVRTKIARKVLLKTDGQLMSAGRLWEITSKRVGPGVYRLCTKRWEG